MGVAMVVLHCRIVLETDPMVLSQRLAVKVSWRE